MNTIWPIYDASYCGITSYEKKIAIVFYYKQLFYF